MTETSTSPRHPGHLVTAVLVSHDGAPWLPDVLDALASQTRQPERFVAADTDSSDGSVAIITERLGSGTVVRLPRRTTFGDAVQAGIDAFGRPSSAASARVTADDIVGDDERDEPDAAVVEWIWMLHDDCAPDPRALDELLIRATHSPSVWLIGPKVRSWDDGRLLEAGKTIDPTGHVDVGVDGVELDQGQRDDVDEVLAVSTAGALIRRDAWERLGGLDPAWPAYADDVDLGWRINAAGGRVVVATRAIVRHARAQTLGRRSPATRQGTPAVVRRRSGMQVVLTNTAAWLVPLLVLRYVVGGLLRSIGLLLASRRPAQAWAELRAVAGVLGHPRVVTTGRRDRSGLREVPHRELRHLFPSASARWRSSPFRIGRLGSDRATTGRGSTSTETGPVAEEAESLTMGDSAIAGFFRRPGTILFLSMSLLAVVAERHLLSSLVHGGRLLPAPDGSRSLWSTYVATFHPSSVGSAMPAPPSLAVLAVVSTILFGKVWLAVDVLMLGAVPLSALSAYTAARPLTGAVRVRVWAAIAYSLLPAVTGAIAGGRIDVVVVSILLPQVLRACVSAVRRQPGPGAWRRSIGAGLVLAIAVAFAPILWLIAVPALVLGVGLLDHESRHSGALLRRLASVAVILVVPVVVLVPWSWHLFAHPRMLPVGTGLPEFYASTKPPSGLALLLLRAGGVAQPPVWIGIPVLAAALLGLTRRSRVALARLGVALLIGGVAIAVALTRNPGVTDGVPASRHWPGLVLLVAGAGALLSALVAAVGARPALRGQSFGWRQPAAVGIVGLALVSTVWLAAGWVVRGAGAPLNDRNPHVLPLFTQSELQVPTTPRALVLNDTGRTVTYALVRRPSGPVLGDADTAPAQAVGAAGRSLASAVRDLVAGRPGAGNELAPLGIQYVVASSDSARRLAPALGRATTLTVVPAPGATVWRSSLRTGELTVLSPTAAATATSAGAASAPIADVLPAHTAAANVMVPAGPTGRLIVLAEPVNSGWHATVNGTSLQRRTAYGWAQAFVVPPNGGRLRIGFRDGRRDAALIGELAAVAVVLGSLLPGRRPDDLGAAA